MTVLKSPSLTPFKTDVVLLGMGRLLDRLIQGSPAYEVKAENDGFSLVGKPDRLDEFSDLVHEAVDHASEDFVVFPTSDGGHRYSRMFVVPLDNGTIR